MTEPTYELEPKKIKATFLRYGIGAALVSLTLVLMVGGVLWFNDTSLGQTMSLIILIGSPLFSFWYIGINMRNKIVKAVKRTGPRLSIREMGLRNAEADWVGWGDIISAEMHQNIFTKRVTVKTKTSKFHLPDWYDGDSAEILEKINHHLKKAGQN